MRGGRKICNFSQGPISLYRLSQKRRNAEPRLGLLWMVNRKSHTRFRLVPKSLTLDGRFALHCRKHPFFGAHHKYLNEDRPIYHQRQKCRPITLVSGNYLYRYSKDFLGEQLSYRSGGGGVEIAEFAVFLLLCQWRIKKEGSGWQGAMPPNKLMTIWREEAQLPQRNSASDAHVYLGWLTDRAI